MKSFHQSKDGVHTEKTKKEELSKEQIALMQSQDLNYVTSKVRP